MKLTKEDFKTYDASYNEDQTEIWIYKRIFKRKYVLFGEWLRTEEFQLIIDGDSPLTFPNLEEAEKFINSQL